MAVNMSAFPFNSISGDRVYNAEDFQKYFGQFVGNGIFPNPSTNLQVVTALGLKVTVKPGSCYINGVLGFIEEEKELDIEPGDGTYNRYDLITARLDTNTRTVSLNVIKGTASSDPIPPSVVRDVTKYDLCLASVLVKKGATNINQLDISDRRLNSNCCGLVTGLIQQIDTTTLFNDMKNFEKYMEETLKTEWLLWVEANKGIFANADPGAAISSEIVDAREGETSILNNLRNYVKNGVNTIATVKEINVGSTNLKTIDDNLHVDSPIYIQNKLIESNIGAIADVTPEYSGQYIREKYDGSGNYTVFVHDYFVNLGAQSTFIKKMTLPTLYTFIEPFSVHVQNFDNGRSDALFATVDVIDCVKNSTTNKYEIILQFKNVFESTNFVYINVSFVARH